MIEPYDYYLESDSIAETLSDVRRNIDAINAFAATHGHTVFWRGQANHEWGLVSSLARQLSTAAVVDDRLLNRVEQAILDEAATWISDLNQPPYAEPLAKLAYLQHHGIPTRLLDFTSNPWMATFFAADSLDQVDGRVFAIMLQAADVFVATPAGTPWRTFRTNEVKVYNPSQAGVVFPRLQAQNGVLAFGRLPSTQPHRKARDRVLGKSRALLAEEVRRILSIPFKLSPFKPTHATPIPAGAKTPIGLTFRLHIDKESIRRDLAGVASGRRISPAGTAATHRSVYPDASGMVAHSKIIQGLKKGVLVI